MSNIYATTSGKGGVGKSSVATGLALAFAQLGSRILLIDMDEGLRCLDIMLGLDNEAVLDLSDALDAPNISDIAYPCGEKELYLLPAPCSSGQLCAESLASFTSKAESLYDIIIFDFPAGLDFTLYSALPEKTVFLCVATPDPVSVRDASFTAAKLIENGFNSRLIINRFNYKTHFKRRQKSIDGIIDTAALRLLGIVPESEEIGLLPLYHRLNKKKRPFKAFTRIAKRLSGLNVPLINLKKI